MRSSLLLGLSFAIAVLCVSPAHGQYVEIYKVDQAAKDVAEQQTLNEMSMQLGVSVNVLKQQKDDGKLSFGELYVAHQIAKAAKVDFKAIVDDYKSGKAWGVVAKERKVEMDGVGKAAREMETRLKKSQSASK